MPPFNQVLHEEIINLYLEGNDRKAIVQKTGRSLRTIGRHLHQEGLGREGYKRFSDNELAQALEMRSRGMGPTEIARNLGRSRKTIRVALKKEDAK